MEITASMVKTLRAETGAGMMDCKKALTEADGDIEKAVDILRTKGLADLAKKAGRATFEGIIGSYVADDGRSGVLVEVNCETDFVALNDDFKTFVASIAKHIAASAPEDVPALMAQPFVERPELTVEKYLGEYVAKLGENMVISRFTRYEVSDNGVIGAYVHGVGNIGVLVQLATDSAASQAPELATLLKDLAMQVAASAPIAVSEEQVSAEVIEHEKSIYMAQAAETGKPEQIQLKIAEGRLQKFFKEVCLLEQLFVKDPDITVGKLVTSVGRELGIDIKVVRFTRFLLGETNPEAKPQTAC